MTDLSEDLKNTCVCGFVWQRQRAEGCTPCRAMTACSPRVEPRSFCAATGRGPRPGRSGRAKHAAPPGRRGARRVIVWAETGSGSGSGDDTSGDASSARDTTLESQFMAILREQTTRRRLEMETRWKQGGLRPRVVHESSSEWIRRVSFQWPLAAMGTASGAVLVSECTETGGSPDSRRQRSQRLVASASDAHSRDWANADERGLGERSLLGL